MSDLPDVEATVKLVKEILSESLDLVSEKRRFRAFLQDYSRQAHVEKGLLLEGKHLKALASGMGYPGFDEVASRNKAAAPSVGLQGLGDWLARTEGYDGALCQWVEEVWSQSFGEASHRRAEEDRRRKADEQARRRNADEQAKRREEETRRQQAAARQRVKEQHLRREKERKADEQAKRREEEARQRQVADNKVKVFRDPLRSGGQGPEMVVLPTGRFRMGDLDGSGHGSERPVRTVTISRPIAMGKYPVTFEEYGRFVSATGAVRPADCGWGRGTRPVIHVSQEDAKAYAVWLSEQTGKRYRLPSEAEWEYAARAGTTTRYSWGDNISCSQARYGRRSGGECSDSDDGTVAVGSFAANPFGLYDMHGNVLEWVEDCWHDNYEGAPSDGSAWTTGGDNFLWLLKTAVLRGGSWLNDPQRLRSAVRLRYRPSDRYYDLGFRLVQDLNP